MVELLILEIEVVIDELDKGFVVTGIWVVSWVVSWVVRGGGSVEVLSFEGPQA